MATVDTPGFMSPEEKSKLELYSPAWTSIGTHTATHTENVTGGSTGSNETISSRGAGVKVTTNIGGFTDKYYPSIAYRNYKVIKAVQTVTVTAESAAKIGFNEMYAYGVNGDYSIELAARPLPMMSYPASGILGKIDGTSRVYTSGTFTSGRKLYATVSFPINFNYVFYIKPHSDDTTLYVSDNPYSGFVECNNGEYNNIFTVRFDYYLYTTFDNDGYLSGRSYDGYVLTAKTQLSGIAV